MVLRDKAGLLLTCPLTDDESAKSVPTILLLSSFQNVSDFMSCSVRDWLYKWTNSHTTYDNRTLTPNLHGWQPASGAVSPEVSVSQLPYILPPLLTQDQTEKAKTITEEAWLPFSISLASPWQWTPFREYLKPSLVFTIKISHFSACLWVFAKQKWWWLTPCHSKFWVNSFCFFSFGWPSSFSISFYLEALCFPIF